MRFDIYRMMVSAAFLTFAAAASAQNLDPTVVVDRAYEGRLMEVHKPALEMAVPDTVSRFDLDFDYSVFESPYKGSYEFNPYLLSMKPAASADGTRKLYLKAGAGYQLHPVLDVVYSPDLKVDDVRVDIYAKHRSFIGNYWNIERGETLDGMSLLDRMQPYDGAERTWTGYDLESCAGASGRGDWNGGYVDFGAGYYNLASQDRGWNRSYNALDAYMSLSSKTGHGRLLRYSVDAGYRMAHDAVRGFSLDKPSLMEYVYNVDASAEFGKIRVDVGFEGASYSEALAGGAFQIYAVPHYLWTRGRLKADLGLRIAKIFDGNEGDGAYGAVDVEQIVYPDVNVEFVVLKDALKAFARLGGGNRINTYASLLKGNHHLNMTSGLGTGPLLDFDVERVSVSAGVDGRIGSRMSCVLSGGLVNYANGLLYQVPLQHASTVVTEAGVGYASYSRMYASFEWLWKDESVMFDGSVSYNTSWGDAFSEGSALLKPAALTGDVAFEYNWNRRIFGGVDCSFASARSSSIARIPGYADLGVSAEFVTSRRLSVWLRGGNLLGMTIQRNPLYAEKGAYFTAGICLNL